MKPTSVARALVGLQVLRGRPTAAQWVEALQIIAHVERTPGHWLQVEFTPGGTARIIEHPLPANRIER